MKWLFIYLMIFLSENPDKIKLNVEINGIKTPGKLFLAVYDDPLVFESSKSEEFQNQNNADKRFHRENLITEVIEDTKMGIFRKSIYLPVGVYAVSFYIDSNNNQKLDFNFFGIPTEQYGFSNNSMGFFGPPSFDQASFTIDKESKISIKAR